MGSIFERHIAVQVLVLSYGCWYYLVSVPDINRLLYSCEECSTSSPNSSATAYSAPYSKEHDEI